MNYNTEWQAYLDSKEGQSALDLSEIGSWTSERSYLQNRLHNAFDAGYAAGMHIAEERAMERLRKAVFGNNS